MPQDVSWAWIVLGEPHDADPRDCIKRPDFHCRQNALSIRLSDQSRHVQNALLACRLRQLHSDICAIADSLNIKFNYSLITLHGALMPLFSFIWPIKIRHSRLNQAFLG
jgi:hypothetical protein